MSAPTPTYETLAKDFYTITDQVGSVTLDYATMNQTPLHDSRYSQQARNIMVAQGWDGTGGIGVNKQGRAEPIGTEIKSPRRCPLVGIATSEEHRDEWGPEVYGYLTRVYGQERIQFVDFTYQGRPILTSISNRCDHDRARSVRCWKAVLGIAENTYPNPQGVTFKEVVTATPLNRLTVKLLTKAFIEYAWEPSRAQAVWEAKLAGGARPPLASS